MARVQALLANPGDSAAIPATFSPAFLAAVPADKVKDLFTAIKSEIGACTARSAQQVKSDTAAVVRIQCEHGAINATIVVNAAPPHLIEGLLLKPAP